MTVTIGSARIDENGKAHGGQAGDQTGREVSTQVWYKHSKGWRVFRAKDRLKALRIAQAMRAACKNANIGYDQYQRLTLYNLVKPLGFDPAKADKKCETDCSALVRVCCAFAGIFVDNFTTPGEPKILLASGEFTELKGGKYTDQPDFLGAGDILVTPVQGHTVVVLDDGPQYEGAVIADERPLGEAILRFGDCGEAVKSLQTYLIKLQYDVGRCGADGDFGPDTESALKSYQEDHGLTPDGEYGPKTHASLMAELDKLADEPPQPEPPAGDLTVAKGSWNVRTGPGTNYAVAGTVHGGDKLLRAKADGWIPILHNGEVRWISQKGLEG